MLDDTLGAGGRRQRSAGLAAPFAAVAWARSRSWLRSTSPQIDVLCVSDFDFLLCLISTMNGLVWRIYPPRGKPSATTAVVSAMGTAPAHKCSMA
ncbi:hypothetical protein FHX06_005946 [Rhizobium sp. BK512]|uniref:hypothetical protein n=1 Tax=Rhizobium sp. BK512 TaxID=2587010 RepID=UPI0013AF8585|nr:hypothetical protein [Rhizobium sp. BK512]MBB3564582.1 hypothetical protein [Rhizobium sp. BK512]